MNRSWNDDAITAGAQNERRGEAGPVRQLSPDAWLVYRFGEQRLAAFLEIDRGTVRGNVDC